MASRQPSIEDRMERFTVAAHALIEAYGDLMVRGEVREPGETAAALVQFDDVITALSLAGFEDLQYSGSDVNELDRRKLEFHRHNCTCPWCPKGTEAP